ncbi:MAG: hypothetical protein AAGJ35_10520 [Myxococcota bacterium]
MMVDKGDEPQLAYFNTARSHHVAAIALGNMNLSCAFPDLPVRQSLLIALELYLKCWLLENGVTKEQVRAFGHDLQTASERARSLGLKFWGMDEELLQIISQDKTLIEDRYIAPGKMRRVPNIEPMSELCDYFFEQCRDFCFNPDRPMFLTTRHFDRDKGSQRR